KVAPTAKSKKAKAYRPNPPRNSTPLTVRAATVRERYGTPLRHGRGSENSMRGCRVRGAPGTPSVVAALVRHAKRTGRRSLPEAPGLSHSDSQLHLPAR